MNNPKHKLVPLKPTEEMISAGTDFMLNHIIDPACTEQVYKRMLAASPTQPQSSLHELRRYEIESVSRQGTVCAHASPNGEWINADELTQALAAESELRGLEQTFAAHQARNVLVLSVRNDGWIDLHDEYDNSCARYLELRGLLERHPTNETLVRLREDG